MADETETRKPENQNRKNDKTNVPLFLLLHCLRNGSMRTGAERLSNGFCGGSHPENVSSPGPGSQIACNADVTDFRPVRIAAVEEWCI